ncbi:MAG: restriction endonuclease [Candidatus Binatia bacterium]
MSQKLPTYSRWSLVPESLKTTTQAFKAAGLKVREDAEPRARFRSQYYHRWYDLYSAEETVPIRKIIRHAPEVLSYTQDNILAAIRTINDSAKRSRDSATRAYKHGRHSFATQFSAQKSEYYALKDAVLARLLQQGRATHVGYHSKTDYRDPVKPRWRSWFNDLEDWDEFDLEFDDLISELDNDDGEDGQIKSTTVLEVIQFAGRLFHRPVNNLLPEDVEILQHLGDRLSPARPLSRLRLCDAEITLRQYLSQPTLVLPLEITDVAGVVRDGEIIRVVGIAWLRILEELRRDPLFLYQFSKHPRNFEEFIAAVYAQAGFDEVVLTPRSGDFGRDVIAIRRGSLCVRVLDQCKAHSPDHVVTANDVRAMLGVLSGDPNASKACITTTASFAPGIENDPFIAPSIPYRLELRNGIRLRRWLSEITGDATLDVT